MIRQFISKSTRYSLASNSLQPNLNLDTDQEQYGQDKTGSLFFFLNGNKQLVPLIEVDPEQNLLHFLRGKHFKGTKRVCQEGGCGACTVLLSTWNTQQKIIEYSSVASCLIPLPTIDNTVVTTIEGLTERHPGLHPLQEAFLLTSASQCGFCTPGFIMSLYSSLCQIPNATMKQLEQSFDGNLCRCTGYRPILDASKIFASDYTPKSQKEEDIRKQYLHLQSTGQFKPLFPQELEINDIRTLKYFGPRSSWFKPFSLDEFLKIVSDPERDAHYLAGTHSFPWKARGASQSTVAKLVAGYTEIGYQLHQKPGFYPTFIDLSGLSKLKTFNFQPDTLIIGAGVSITKIQHTLKKAIKDLTYTNPAINRLLTTIVHQTKYFANRQVRDRGTPGGSLVTCSKLSDFLPVASAFEVKLEILSPRGTRMVSIDDWIDPETSNPLIEHDEIIVNIHFPLPSSPEARYEHSCGYKQSRRRVDSQATVTAVFRIRLNPETKLVEHARFSVGGMSRPGYRAEKTEAFFLNKPFTLESFSKACLIFENEISKHTHPKLPPSHQEYQISAAIGLFYKFFLTIRRDFFDDVIPLELSATQRFDPAIHIGRQEYTDSPGDSIVGKSMTHFFAKRQVTGEAEYVADMLMPPHGLFAQLVHATSPRAKILSIDPSKALSAPGVVGFYSAKDVPGINLLGFRVDDEEIFASRNVEYYSQPIGILVARTSQFARRGADLVEVEYQDLEPVLTIEDAIKKSQFFDAEERRDKFLLQGDPDAIFADTEKNTKVISGVIHVGNQDHFYLEGNNILVLPDPKKKMVIHASTQSPTQVQQSVSKALGIDYSKIECRVERIGGGFGGKQIRTGIIASMAAIPAYHLDLPIKLVLLKEEDMQISGSRPDFRAEYKAAYSSEGSLVALDVTLYCNCGYVRDYAVDILDTATLVIENAYNIPNVKVTPIACRTNTSAHTATRGFGKPQASAIIESIVEDIAIKLNLDPGLVRTKNLYQLGDVTLTNNIINDDALSKCWDDVYPKYQLLREQVDEFNTNNRWTKRGVAIIPSKGNIGFIDWPELNRGTAVVQLYKDGSLYISHSGVEMGQGLNTRMVQLAAEIVPVPIESIIIDKTSTAMNPNTPPTTMVSTDLIGGAITQCCKELMAKIDPWRQKLGPEATWASVVEAAHYGGVTLSATAVSSTEELVYNWKKQEGDISYFFVWGAGLSLVEMDVLTGSWKILRTDITQDCGNSLNPILDIGQIEGSFMMGVGYYTLEEFLWNNNGSLFSNNTISYKIPTYDDTPAEWNVSILKDSPSVKGIYHSKGVGEANVQLGLSVFFAIKDAISAARSDVASDVGDFQLEFPSTVTEIRKHIPKLTEYFAHDGVDGKDVSFKSSDGIQIEPDVSDISDSTRV